MKKIIFVLIIFSLNLIYANSYHGMVKITGKNEDKIIIHGTAKIEDCTINELSINGPLEAENITVLNDTSIIGTLEGKGLKFNNINIIGPVEVKNMSANNLSIIGSLDGEKLDIKGEFNITGSIEVKKVIFKIWK